MSVIDPKQKCWADGGDGRRIGFCVKPEHEQADGTLKATIQIGDKLYKCAYREPKERDSGGSGLTFWFSDED